LASVQDYPKESEVKDLATEYMTKTVRKAQTVTAGGTVKAFVDGEFFPRIQKVLAKGTVALYRQAWNRLEPHLGHIRLRDAGVPDVQAALDAIHAERGETIGHGIYMQRKVACSAIFAHAVRSGHHPGPNPEDGTTVRGYGHTNHRENGAYKLEEVKQFLKVFPAGPVAVAIGINAFLALRKPEAEALLLEDYDAEKRRIRIHRNTKTGNDEILLVGVAPLANLLADGWEQVNLRRAEYEIRKKIEGTNLVWKGWYAFRRGLATNLYRLGMKPEEACLILRNSAEVVRRHYLRLEQEGTRIDAMARLEQAFNECGTAVGQIVIKTCVKWHSGRLWKTTSTTSPKLKSIFSDAVAELCCFPLWIGR
jgi:integrase